MRPAREELCEFSGERIPFEEFVKRPVWQTLPFLIQLALLHLRRSEQHPLPEPEIESGALVACLPPAREAHHPS
jgi:hypothetical protein